jgi:hypothetical protein
MADELNNDKASPRADNASESTGARPNGPLPTSQAIALIIPLIILGFAILLFWNWQPEPLTIEKTILKESIIKVVQNGADLRAVKQIYYNRGQTIEFKLRFATRATHYPESIPLSVVLEDIRVDLFLPSADKSLLPMIDAIIAQHSQTNPFDALETFQRDHFERLREKLGERYHVVQAEVTRISDELRQKNLLTEEYLRSSNLSFWVSVIGLVFSLLIGGMQIFLWMRTSSFHTGAPVRTPPTT